MLDKDKNLTDSVKDTGNMPVSYSSNSPSSMSIKLSYKKTDKLITALYMVTDNMEKDEPMRLKLRTLGTDIISDTLRIEKTKASSLIHNIGEILSLLNIASDIGMVSEMNANILKKEFLELRKSIYENTNQNNHWLEEFLARPQSSDFSDEEFSKHNNNLAQDVSDNNAGQIIGYSSDKGQGMAIQNRIGVQKGSTLLKAIKQMSDNIPLGHGSDVSGQESNNNFSNTKIHNIPVRKNSNLVNFELLKNKRREEIISIIRDRKSKGMGDGATITDIKNGAKDTLVSCGDKTLQRELVSMVSDKILYRTGSKRWSQYFLQN